MRLRDEKGQPLSDDRLHAEFSIMFIGGVVSGKLTTHLGVTDFSCPNAQV